MAEREGIPAMLGRGAQCYTRSPTGVLCRTIVCAAGGV